jgi:nucleoid-associated protein YgaU
MGQNLAGLLSHQPNQISVAKLLKAFNVQDRTYTVQLGDTLSDIALRLNFWFDLDVTWEDLARINELKNPDLILEGQVLNLFV